MVAQISVLCAEDYLPAFQEGMRRYAQRRPAETSFHQDRQSFLHALQHRPLCDLLIIAVPGAQGMEDVISARSVSSELPILWCSDDEAFAVTSYRLRCSLFLALPVTAEQVERAMEHCLEAKETNIEGGMSG